VFVGASIPIEAWDLDDVAALFGVAGVSSADIAIIAHGGFVLAPGALAATLSGAHISVITIDQGILAAQARVAGVLRARIAVEA
jgi:hypothetical protein